ncbi:MAG: hypothetical protein AMXMBFR84_13240 [Candidatus Hydrogenedentota bacterium]
MITVHVRYFALMREQRGLSAEEVRTTASTPRALYGELQRTHGFTLHLEQLKVAINETFGDWDTPLSEGDTVVFVPPVAGG